MLILSAYCWYQEEESCCKASSIDNEICVCCNRRCLEIMPYSCCKCITQCCCIDYRCSYPVERNGEVPCILNFFGITLCFEGACNISVCETVGVLKSKFKDDTISQSNATTGNPLSAVNAEKVQENGTDSKVVAMVEAQKVNESTVPMTEQKKERVAGRSEAKDLNPCCGFCCMMSSIFWKFPDIFGWYISCILCCCKQESIGFKPAVEKGEIFQGDIYVSCEDRVAIIYPTSCCTGINQCFCIDTRCAFPCDSANGVPCLVNLCFINCCYDWKFKPGQTYFKPLGFTMGESV